jgi:lantibiotic modifying enzyme
MEKLLIYEFGQLSGKEDYRWCWGLPGLLKTRLMVMKMLASKEIKKQTEQLIHRLLARSSKFFVNDDCLCHGNSGMVELFNRLLRYRKQNLKEIKEYREQYLNTMTVNRWLNGHFHLLRLRQIETVGLFTGIAGVGLTYLHVNTNKGCSDVLMLTV